MPAQGKQFQEITSFHISLNYLFKTQNPKPRRPLEILPCSQFMNEEGETWKRHRTFPKSHSTPVEKPESVTEFPVPWVLLYMCDVERGLRWISLNTWAPDLTNDKLCFRDKSFLSASPSPSIK